MESAFGAEGEVRRAGQVGDHSEVVGPPLTEETTRRLKGTVQGVTVGQGAKGPDRSRAPRGDRPGAARR
jgi:hypothetical protein